MTVKPSYPNAVYDRIDDALGIVGTPPSLCSFRHPAVARTTPRSGSAASHGHRTDSATPHTTHQILGRPVSNPLSFSLEPVRSCHSTECAGFVGADDPWPRHSSRPVDRRAGSIVKPPLKLASASRLWYCAVHSNPCSPSCCDDPITRYASQRWLCFAPFSTSGRSCRLRGRAVHAKLDQSDSPNHPRI
jgi:hypothetical protein